jgi:dTDP-4-amino-4,6-dideoxygalactose transaminase
MKRVRLGGAIRIDGESEEGVVLRAQPTKELEEQFCRYTGCDHGIATANETAALHLCMMAVDLKRGDKILCSVNAHPNVPEVVRHFDAEPIFVDIDPDEYNIDLDQMDRFLAKNKNKKLKGAIITHVAGQSVDIARLYEIAKKYRIMIIHDLNDGLGATYDGIKIGSKEMDEHYGDEDLLSLATFSFNPHRYHSAYAGGMLTTQNEKINERARLLANNAMITQEWDESGKQLGYIYDVVDIGLEYGMSDLEAGVCGSVLEQNDQEIERRRAIAKIYDERLASISEVTTPVKRRDHIYSRYIIRIDKNRDSFAKELYKRGVETGLHYIPLHLLSYYRQKYNLRVNDYPKALHNFQQILSIPIHGQMSNEDAHYVADMIEEVARSRV